MNEASSIRSGLLAAGNFIIDQVKVVDVWPEQDSLATILEISRSNGGGPYNVLKDLALLGAPFPLLAAGRVGDDENGEDVRSDCAAHGIEVGGLLVTEGVPTAFTDVMTVKGTGRRTFFYHPGANARFGEDDVSFGGDGGAKIFYLGYLLLLERLDELAADGTTGASRLLARASEAGLFTVVDLVSGSRERFSRLVPPALPFVDCLFLNEYEAGSLLGKVVGSGREEMIAAAAGVLEMGVRGMVVLHSPAGTVLVDREGGVATQGSVQLPSDQLRGAVGAGDAFAAGVLHGLHEGWEKARCLEAGVCAAAVCLTDETTSGGLCGMAEALERGRGLGFRDFV